jgi:tetratricopeptide (TPR) repeat protein
MTVDARAANNLLACLLDLDRHEEVLARGPEIAEFSPGNPGPPANIARAALLSAKLDVAERWAREAVGRGGGRASHFVLLGHILEARGKLDEAAAAYGRSLELNPEDEEARAGLVGVTTRVLE